MGCQLVPGAAIFLYQPVKLHKHHGLGIRWGGAEAPEREQWVEVEEHTDHAFNK